jgi:hypothetical protein
MQKQRRFAGSNPHIAGRFERRLAADGCQPDRRHIGSRLDDQIELELAVLSVVINIDAWVDASEANTRKARHIHAMLIGTAAKIMGPCGKRVDRLRFGGSVALDEMQIEIASCAVAVVARRGGASIHKQADVGRRQENAIAKGACDEATPRPVLFVIAWLESKRQPAENLGDTRTAWCVGGAVSSVGRISHCARRDGDNAQYEYHMMPKPVSTVHCASFDGAGERRDNPM